LTSLDISSNALAGFNLPEGWSGPDADGDFKSPRGTYEKCPPAEAEAILDGIIALANAIPDMGAMTSLCLASTGLGVEGAKLIAAVLPKCT
jgi:hypothetical protein